MEEDMFMDLFKLQLKTVMLNCKELLQLRTGEQTLFIEKARETAGKTKEVSHFLENYGRSELAPLAKDLSTSVAILIRQSNIPATTPAALEECLRNVAEDVRGLLQAAALVMHAPPSPKSTPALNDAQKGGNSKYPAAPPPNALKLQGSSSASMANLSRNEYAAHSGPAYKSSEALISPRAKETSPFNSNLGSRPDSAKYLDEVDIDEDDGTADLKRKLAELKMQQANLDKQLDKQLLDDPYEKVYSIDERAVDTTICFTCGRRVNQDSAGALSALERLWHKDTCWKCFECKNYITIGDPFGADGDYIYCDNCYRRKFFCSYCGEFIEGEADDNPDGLFHPLCYFKFQDEKEAQKKEAEQKEDEEFKKWAFNFNKTATANAAKSMAPTQTVAQSGPAATPAATPATTSPASPASPATNGAVTPKSQDPPSAQNTKPSVTGVFKSLAPVTTQSVFNSLAPGTNSTIGDLYKKLGPPPPLADQGAYKDYMKRKYDLQQLENAELLRQKKAAGA